MSSWNPTPGEQVADVNRFRAEFGLSKLVPLKRKCLRCDKDFKSVGSFNRMCDRCRVKPPNQGI